MRKLKGRVSSGYGLAGPSLRTVEHLILARTGLPSMAGGTLNVQLDEPYIVKPDAVVEPTEYFKGERLKLQRCRVRGYRMWIMRPESHEVSGKPGVDVLELVASFPLRESWGLTDGDVLVVEVEGNEDWWEAGESEAAR